MKDKCVLVTGSSSGIGYEITSKLLDLGAKVIGIARNHDKSKLENENYITHNCDVSNYKKLETLLKQILKKHPEINCLISNAGYGDFKSLENFSDKQICDFLNLNLTSHILVSKYLVRHMKRRIGGDIIFLGSEAALVGKRQASLYSAAKFGLRGFAQALRDECGKAGIRVCLINPGFVRSPFFESLNFAPGIEENNAIEPEDVAKVILDIINLRKGTIIDEVNLSPASKSILFK